MPARQAIGRPSAAPHDGPDVLAAWETARRTHGDLGVSVQDLATEALAGLERRRTAAGLPADETTLRTLLPTLALGDLYLARACERGVEAAWRTLHRTYAPRLAALLRKREGRALDVESTVDELFSELALTPAAGGARTRIAGYDGSGSLLGWLAATLLHRLARRGREREHAAGDLAGRDAPPGAPAAGALLDHEAALALDRALAEAWPRLEREERAAVVWRYRHGLSQRRMAQLLSVGEERVSRWVSRALAKLRGALESLEQDGLGEPRSDRYEALLSALERRLARFEIETALPRDPEERA